jgi:hypothetical protein
MTKMPYVARARGEDAEVLNEKTGEVKATLKPPDAYGKAEKKAELLNSMENDEEWEA